MGFFDKLDDIWHDVSPFDSEQWKPTLSALDSSRKSIAAMYTNHSLYSAVASLAMAPNYWGSWDDKAHDGIGQDTGWSATRIAFKNYWGDSVVPIHGTAFADNANAGLKALQGTFEAPVLKQTAETYLWTQNEAFKRPTATTYLVFGDVIRFRDASRLFDIRQAYNDTRRVSMGQAFVYGEGAALGVEKPDPRTPEGMALYNGPNADPWLKRLSGTADFAMDVGADPLFAVGVPLKAAKLALVSKPLRAGTTAKEAAELAATRQAYVSGKNFDKGYEYARLNSWEKFHRAVFADKAQGRVASSILSSLAKIEDEALSRAAYANAMLAAMGDVEALTRLRGQAPDIAQAIARTHAAPDIRDAAARINAGQAVPGAGKLYGGVLKGDLAAKIADEVPWKQLEEGIAEGKGLFGDLQTAPGVGVLVGENLPRVSFTGAAKAGVHEFLASKARWAIGGMAARDLLPSARYTQLVAIATRNSLDDFLANTERATKLPLAERAKFVESYARASNPLQRKAIIVDYEKSAFVATVKHYGFTEEQGLAMLPYINKARSNQSALLSGSRVRMAEEFRKAATQALADAQPERARLLEQAAADYDEAVRLGKQPLENIHLLDADGNHVQFALRYGGLGDSASALANPSELVPMMDFRTFESALWWAKNGPLKADGSLGGYTAINAMMGLVDATQHVWKTVTLLRPGYVGRVLSDEVLRGISVLGVTKFIQNFSEGVYRGAHNMAGRSANLAEVADSLVRTGKLPHPNPNLVRALEPAENVTEVYRPGSTTPTRQGARVSADGKEVLYGTKQDMFANGEVGIREWVNTVLKHSQSGGAVHPDVAGFIHRYQSGQSTKAKLHRDMADWANWRANLDVYRSAAWQQSVVTRARAAGSGVVRRRAPRSTPVVVDPYTGKELAVKDLDGFHITNSLRVDEKRSPTTGRLLPAHHHQAVYDYIHTNMDALKRPDSMLAAHMEDGQLVLSVVRQTDAAATEAARGAGPQRLTTFGLEGSTPRWKKNVTTQTYEVRLPDGTLLRYSGPMEGAEGAIYRGLVSARGPNGGYANYISNVENERILASAGDGLRQLGPDQPGYAAQWERAVNEQMGSDPVARQLLAGRNVDDITVWAQRNPEGRRWVAGLGVNQPLYREQIFTIAQVVDKYAPMRVTRLNQSRELRKAILDRRATVQDLADATGRGRMPTIHGAEVDVAFNGTVTDYANKLANGFFKTFGDLPVDAASRFPFFAERYKAHLDELSRHAHQETARYGNQIPVEAVHKIQSAARERALWDVRKYLYDSASRLDLANAFRLVVPFGNAIGDSYLHWGKIIQERPWVFGRLAQLWIAPDRVNWPWLHTEDENGNHKRFHNDGSEYWVHVNPKTGEETVLPDDYKSTSELIKVQLPSGFGPLPEGIKFTQSVNKDTLNTFLNWASAGPIVAVPASEFAMNNPEFGDNWWVRKFVLPFGPSDNPLKPATPGTVRYFWEAFGDKDGATASGQALAIWQTEQMEWRQGRRPDKPTLKEAREKAAGLRWLRFLTYMGGVASQVDTPLQPFADHYRMLQNIPRGPNDETADEQFYREMGPEYSIFVTRLTRNRLGIPTTADSWKRLKKVQDLVAAYPDIAGWLVGADGAGEFSKSVYEAQKRLALGSGTDDAVRQIFSLDDSVDDMERRLGWIEYGRFMDGIDDKLEARGLTKLTQRGAEDLLEQKQKWVQEHQMSEFEPDGHPVESAWFNDYRSLDQAKMLRVLNGFAHAVQDKRIQGRDDSQGFLEYMAARNEVQRQMQQYGVKTLDNKKVAFLADQWHSFLADLKGRNLTFAAMHHRYLENDDLSYTVGGIPLEGN